MESRRYDVEIFYFEELFIVRQNDKILIRIMNFIYNLNYKLLCLIVYIGYEIRLIITRDGSNNTLKDLGWLLERREVVPSDNILANSYFNAFKGSINIYKYMMIIFFKERK